jgi:hypothetical protein
MIIQILLLIIAIYFAFGFLFAILFITNGINKVDMGARGSTIGFRILIIPGITVFWPFLLKRWLNATKGIHYD